MLAQINGRQYAKQSQEHRLERLIIWQSTAKQKTLMHKASFNKQADRSGV